jgi:peroxiredoxin
LEARRDVHHQFLELGIQVLGISINHAYSQKSFAASLKLPYPLLSDYPDGRTILAYGVGYYEGQTKRLYARPSFS